MIRDILCTGYTADVGGYTLGMRVQEGERGIDYVVTLSQIDLERFGSAGETPEDFLIRCFEFLLRPRQESAIGVVNEMQGKVWLDPIT